MIAINKQDTLIRKLAETYTIGEIAKKLNVHYSTIHQYCMKNNIYPKRKYTISEKVKNAHSKNAKKRTIKENESPIVYVNWTLTDIRKELVRSHKDDILCKSWI